MSLQNEIPLTVLKSNDVKASDIPLENIWLGARYELNYEVFNEEDVIQYDINPKVIFFAKVTYPNGFTCYYDIFNKIAAPINTSQLDNGIAIYQIYPYRSLSDFVKSEISGSLSEQELIQLLPSDLREQVIEESPTMRTRTLCKKIEADQKRFQ